MVQDCSRIVGLTDLTLFYLNFAAVFSRECYECRSARSFQDCDANRRRVICLKRTSGIKDEGYVKGCAATYTASSIPQCNTLNYTCEVSCCSSDYCNRASPRAPTESPEGATTSLPGRPLGGVPGGTSGGAPCGTSGGVPFGTSGGALGRALGGVSNPMVNRILLIATFTASVMYLFSC